VVPENAAPEGFANLRRSESTAMKDSADIHKRTWGSVVPVAMSVIAATVLLSGCGHSANANPPNGKASAGNSSPSTPTVDLSASQLKSIKIEPVGSYAFPVEKEAVGNIDYDGDLSVQVFPPYQGTIIQTLVEIGAEVRKDQTLYTIKSPDLIQAESTLIGAAATYELTTKELARARELYTTSVGVPQRELEQAVSDQHTADGALKAARDAVLVFGKTDAEIDQMIASRKIDPALVVRSPIRGKITYKNAQPGFFVQPGNPPAPYSVADVSLKWMFANVPESESGLFRVGQPVAVRVLAYDGRVFKGKVSKIYESVDPNTHRVTIRSDVTDPNNDLRPGMLANFVIRVDSPVEATAIPANGIVREPDGTMTAWTTTDRQRFTERIIKVGLRKEGRVQILDGLQQGELVVSDGAVFLSNMVGPPPSD
jgi:membrane fusion protein, heavy metal efflux system